jgi:hypothetical protein
MITGMNPSIAAANDAQQFCEQHPNVFMPMNDGRLNITAAAIAVTNTGAASEG